MKSGLGKTAYIIQKGVAVKVPGVEELDHAALVLCPLVAICEWCINREHTDGERNKQNSQASADCRVLVHAKE